MKKLLFLFIILCFSKKNIAQPDVKNIVIDANVEVRNVEPFHGVEVSSAISLYLSQGDTDAVAVSCQEASENKKITVVVKNGILKISLENGTWNIWNWKDKKVRAYVTAKMLDYISGTGASTIRISEVINTSTLKINMHGASTFKGEVVANSISLEASGASTLTIEGKTDKLFIDASGASSVKAYDLESNTCDAEASGASSVGLNVKKDLKAEASGASSIRYKGEPTNKNCNASGASSVKARTS